MTHILPESFFTQKDTIAQSKALLGKVLVSQVSELSQASQANQVSDAGPSKRSSSNQLTAGIITEVEAYLGTTDRACHAYGGRRTKRTEMLYQPGGTVYVYLCYGIHHLFNLVVHEADTPHAILIRAIEPLEGMDAMLERRGMQTLAHRLSAGPGSMSKAMGITTKQHNGIKIFESSSSQSGQIWVEDRGITIKKSQIASGPRIGVDYAGADALLPYRFWLKDSLWVS